MTPFFRIFRHPRAPAVLSALACGVVFGIYFLRLPSTVQTGDTGELVASAHLLRVPHPPGYPLYSWLEFAFTRLWPWGSIFNRAAFLTALFSAGTLLLLSLSARSALLGLGTALCLAFSGVFWRYSELPDAFALNCLIAAGILFVYLSDSIGFRAKTWAATLLFFVGLTNHLSIVFVSPVLFHLWLGDRNPRRIAFALAIGAGVTIALYASLLRMHPESPYSWGRLEGASDVLRHFLREDYGRNRPDQAAGLSIPPLLPVAHAADPSPVQEPAGPAGSQFLREIGAGIGTLLSAPTSPEVRYHLTQFWRTSARDLLPILLAGFLVLILSAERKDKRGIILAVSAAGSVLFLFSMIRMSPEPRSTAVLERHYLLPQLLLCFAGARMRLAAPYGSALFRGERLQRIAGTVLLAAAALNFFRYSPGIDYSKNTIIEDYALNFLRQIPEGSGALVLADDDTSYFALRYVQQVHGMRPNATIASPSLLFHPWYVEKLRRTEPRFAFDPEKARDMELQLEEDLLEPNAGKFPIYTTWSFEDVAHFRVTRLALGSHIEPGIGETFDGKHLTDFVFRSRVEEIGTPPSEYDPSRDVFSRYAHLPLSQGLSELKSGDLKKAAGSFKTALERVPYCIPALQNLCEATREVIPDTAECWEHVRRLEASNFNYFRE